MNINNEDFEINIDLLEKEKLVKKINENINNRDYIGNVNFEKSDIYIEEEDSIEKDILELYLLSEIELEKKIQKSKGLLGNLKYFGKKIIKKLVRPYVKPIYEEQNTINGNIVRILDCYNEKLEKLEKSLVIKEKEIQEIKNRVYAKEEERKQNENNSGSI
ncbi:hypothetical protein [Leptotrichia wadei]|uniref:Uncharacterized protein n=1 Tax=Leptotrichia wadei TaxID=157687 RepID=A0A510KB39_9FUSO|nr:hypothetical protein [Leptotrichia wadei]BBM48876.1 hypothetical protein JMUB3934_0146 [Leptotrichia wadei]